MNSSCIVYILLNRPLLFLILLLIEQQCSTFQTRLEEILLSLKVLFTFSFLKVYSLQIYSVYIFKHSLKRKEVDLTLKQYIKVTADNIKSLSCINQCAGAHCKDRVEAAHSSSAQSLRSSTAKTRFLQSHKEGRPGLSSSQFKRAFEKAAFEAERKDKNKGQKRTQDHIVRGL